MTAFRTDLPPEATYPERHPDAPEPGAELPPHYVSCFGCGPGQPHGLHLRIVAGEGLDLSATFEVTADHQGAPGLAHGGLLASAMDEILGQLGHITRMSCVTARLETDFRRPVPVGSTLCLAARVDGVAGRKLYASGEGHLGAPDGPVAVRARALFVQVGLEHFTTHGRPDELDAIRRDPSMITHIGDYTLNP
ncbi:PaaI family thioesterase [Frankia sp. CNm7]|uniref:Acyl-coenzyme A thioesterase THEM4 n=1 Tax=Frankia nepalensis TaxID=1836974 RepID=A0A937UTC4_9ACTN|nr:hotdog fold domain-containing protein [Frankia nepalensis]MBL7497797.1 PaaI family thioesterase [Frankia nepalensis]MBL7511300.1 PaaI family thioesterase [Frankia nepalensis]MBL7517679.1 PaaI family thioesterase [Frankia nepalensis]MBL7629866.1 PaaI family thioesterase [Frankia nepalensis]